MERYKPRHAAPGRIARFIKWTDEPMNGAQMAISSALAGLVTGILIFNCYFG